MLPTISIDLKAPVPVYRQIVDAMRHLLVKGDLKPGDQVPTVRQLAVDLGVHFNTVAQAYRVLADEGWLDLKRHRGAIVLDRLQPAAPGKKRQKQSIEAKGIDRTISGGRNSGESDRRTTSGTRKHSHEGGLKCYSY